MRLFVTEYQREQAISLIESFREVCDKINEVEEKKPAPVSLWEERADIEADMAMLLIDMMCNEEP